MIWGGFGRPGSRFAPGIPAGGGPSRRDLFRAALSGVAAVSAAAPVMAQQKVSPDEAEYQDRPKNGLSCAACALFRPPAACAVVAGTISPHGWCRFFDLPD
jgi:hypothetical protein